MSDAAVRLTGQDFANLLVEAPDTPMHMAVLTIFEGEAGRLPSEVLLARVRRAVALRIPALPELRRVAVPSRLPGGRPRWVPDRDFVLDRHVRVHAVAPPGDDERLMQAAADLMEGMLDRSHPLWELVVLTGLERGRWATLLKVHHSLTDGYGMLQIALELFEGAGAAGLPATAAEATARPPALLRPVLTAVAVVTTVASVMHRTWRGRRAKLLRPIGDQRRLQIVRLDLGAVKDIAHSHGAKVNDVLLELAATGIRAALAARGEDSSGVLLRGLMAVSAAADSTSRTHNRAASIVVSLPLDAPDAGWRLQAIAADSRRARYWQRSGVIEHVMVFVARTPAGRFLSRHQRVVDLAVSNLIGPVTELGLIGDRMVEAIPITPISGNVALNFCALSYAGRLEIGILADADAWQDLSVLGRAMEDGARELAASRVAGEVGLQPTIS